MRGGLEEIVDRGTGPRTRLQSYGVLAGRSRERTACTLGMPGSRSRSHKPSESLLPARGLTQAGMQVRNGPCRLSTHLEGQS